MKHNWEYKQLGSLCNIVRGGSPRPIQNYITDSADGYNWIKIGDVAPGSKYIFSTKEKIKKEGLVKTRQVFIGDFILSNSMSFGRPYILKIDGCIHDGWLAIKDVENHFIPDFLYYYLSAPSTYSIFEKLVKGGVVSNLNSDIVKGIKAPVPPMEVQRQIVAELDKINEVIADCRELLRNLDTLAQSLFYDTFGDPITNPKGWGIKTLGSIAAILGGSTPKTNIEEYWKGDLCWVTPAELKGEKYIIDTERHISEIGRASAGLQLFPINTVLLTSRAPIGKVAIAKTPMYCNQGFKNLICDSKQAHYQYVYSFLSLITELLKEKGSGATFKEISKRVTETIPIPVPPLALQQQFAAQVERIEEQEKTVEATIAELQTLLDCRLDFWFN